jgi:uncharacterized protein (DUF4213/DUF364 family)
MLNSPEAKWAFYDELIKMVPENAIVTDCAMGKYWIVLKSSHGGIGLSHFLPQDTPSDAPSHDELIGCSLSKVASFVKSWDLRRASIGLSALTTSANAEFMANAKLMATTSDAENNAFDFFLDRAKKKKVTVIGHFAKLEDLQKASNLTILERKPHPGDLPDPASEYILPEQDLVFMTGTTIINKTLPRLIELSSGKETYLVGPSVPMFPQLFKYGFHSLSGTIVSDYQKMANGILNDLSEDIFENGGQMVNFQKDTYIKLGYNI